MPTQLSNESLLFTARGAFPKVPGYRMLALLGRGAMGVVYAAVRAESGHLVAIKLLRSDIASTANLARIDRERRILEQLNHAHIARILDSGETPDGSAYLAIEYIEGPTIADYCEEHALDTRGRVRLLQEVCRVVAAAHDRAMIHGDLKPGNILVDLDGHPKLLDFGIARLLTGGEEPLAETGGGPLTPASDVYSLGAILSELTGGADAVLDAIIRHAMAKMPEDRYQNARALADDLAAYLSGRPLSIDTRPQRLRWQAIVVALGLALLPTLMVHVSNSPAVPSEAERASLAARHLWSQLSQPELRRAESWFRKSVETNPHSATAHAGLADALSFKGEFDRVNPSAAFSEARTQARRAIELDDRLPLAHAVLGSVLFASDRKWTYAEAEFQQALKLDAKCVRAMQGYASMLMRLGRLGEAGALMKRARLLDPASPILALQEAQVPFYGRRFEVARDLLRGVLARDPSCSLAHYYLALCYRFLGQPGAAEAEMRMARLSEQEMSAEVAWIRGRSAAREQLQRLLDADQGNPNIVFVAIELGKNDIAFELLEKAIRQRVTLMLGVKVDPRYDGLRSDPRYEGLLRQAGLANLP
ncbi:protein kinase domain-containing protein [Paludibaculum fermentans]|uniref:Protein kinase n=1 Tax=Paludibaculum fermentans TaxID=1473598 RepID=A0A7S7NTM5_PALFE|nr:protein kinase [Paludibaculum fermentans]QOY89562.1 protein kinase [Paludibaculum fermentans]